MRLEIHPVGNPQFPRYIIATSDGEVFDGTGWNRDQHRAVLFTEGQDVALAFNALQEEMYKKMPLTEFTVSLNIRVRAGEPFTKEQLGEYLENACCIMLDHEKGTGPTPNSMVQLGVTWREMEEKGITEKEG